MGSSDHVITWDWVVSQNCVVGKFLYDSIIEAYYCFISASQLVADTANVTTSVKS